MTRILGYTAKRAVPTNLAISLLTVTAAFLARNSAVSYEGLLPVLPTVMVLGVASMIGAYVGAASLRWLHETSLEKIIMVLLVIVGDILITESMFALTAERLFNEDSVNLMLQLGLGCGIGVISSVLISAPRRGRETKHCTAVKCAVLVVGEKRSAAKLESECGIP